MDQPTAENHKPELQEIASVRRDVYTQIFGNTLQNTDATLATRGQGRGLKIYDEIERDGHAFAILQKRKLAVVSRPWEVQPASDTPLDKAAAELVGAQLKAMNFDKLTHDLLDAVLKGYSVAELMYIVRDNQVAVERHIPRDQRRFVFDDEYRLHMLTRENMVQGELMPDRKFLVHTFGGKDGSPYGLGLGSILFWPVFFKRKGIAFWLTFADKFGSPTSVGKYPQGTSEPDQAKLLAAIEALAQDTGVIIPEGMLIEFLEASRTGSIDTYEKLCRYMDTQISLAVLGEELSTSAKPTGLGSGVADVQNDVRLELVKADADLLSSGPMKLLSAWITEFNVPGAKPPSIYRIVEEAQDLSALAERDSKIAAMGFKPTLKYITDTYGGEWVEVTPRPAPGPGFPSPLFAEPGVGAPAQARLDSAITGIPETVLQRQAEAALAPVLDLVRGGASFSEIMEKLATTFPDMHTDGLEELLARAMFASDLWGQVNTNAGRT